MSQSEFSCFLVRNQYPGGNIYWHGFSEKKFAQDLMRTFNVLDVKSTLYFGVVELSEAQSRDCRRINGSVFDERQIKQMKEVDDESAH